MDVSFLPLQSRLEFLSPLQLFVGMSGQYPSPTVFLSRVRLRPNEQHSSIHSDPRWSLAILWASGSLILTCFLPGPALVAFVPLSLPQNSMRKAVCSPEPGACRLSISKAVALDDPEHRLLFPPPTGAECPSGCPCALQALHPSAHLLVGGRLWSWTAATEGLETL